MTLPTEPRARAAALRARMNVSVPVKAVEPVRMDWTEEFPCVHRGSVSESLGCGCGGRDIVTIHECLQGGGCVPLPSNRSRLMKNYRTTAMALKVCESCPIRSPSP